MPSKEYYDPVKAREYYLRTRKLKGRNKGSEDEPKTSKEKKKAKEKEAKAFETGMRSARQKQVSEAVNAEKKAKLEALRKQNKEVTTRLRGIATMKRTAIRERLQKFMAKVGEADKVKREKIANQNRAEKEKLAAKRKADLEKLSEKTKRDIEALPPMPKGLGDLARDQWRENRRAEIEKIRGKADTERNKLLDASSAKVDKANENTSKLRTALREGTGKIKEAARNEAGGQREMVAAELKNSLGNARADYDKKRNALVEQYKQILQREKEKVS